MEFQSRYVPIPDAIPDVLRVFSVPRYVAVDPLRAYVDVE
jgi:hypothetical protein